MVFAFILVAFIKLLFVTDSPRLVAGLCTGLAGIGAIVDIATGAMGPLAALVALILRGVIAFGYFWSLFYLPTWSGRWWLVVIAGALLMAIV